MNLQVNLICLWCQSIIRLTVQQRNHFLADSIKVQHENDKHEMEEKFRERLYQVSEEFSAELTTNKEELQARHKKQLGKLHAGDVFSAQN